MACPYDDQQVFEPSGAAKKSIAEHMKNDKASPIFNTTLVYLQGCESLYGPSNFTDKATVVQLTILRRRHQLNGSKSRHPAQRMPS